VTTRANGFAKRSLDVCASALGLVLLSPVLVAVAWAVAHHLGRPVLFRQQRPGRGGHLFTMVKFRTMRPADPGRAQAAHDAERLTRFGRLLRSTSLDELPTLWNVLRGDMSLVGPRPLLPEYLTRYTARQARRHEVRPGITGWAQTHGRNALSWEERFERDVWYVEHQSVWLDMRILWRTIAKVWHREGINQPGQATVTEFLGTEALTDSGLPTHASAPPAPVSHTPPHDPADSREPSTPHPRSRAHQSAHHG
jgi:lipopolysaccharide/colanic/teichoic acid biosynthesis glycosyltransferase